MKVVTSHEECSLLCSSVKSSLCRCAVRGPQGRPLRRVSTSHLLARWATAKSSALEPATSASIRRRRRGSACAHYRSALFDTSKPTEIQLWLAHGLTPHCYDLQSLLSGKTNLPFTIDGYGTTYGNRSEALKLASEDLQDLWTGELSECVLGGTGANPFRAHVSLLCHGGTAV